jgi:Flp pilus assembly protein TadB
MSTVDQITKDRPFRRLWPLERLLFLMAGAMTILSVLLAALVSPWFLLLTAFVGANQLAFVAFGNCPSSWLLQRHAGFQRGCPR